MPRAFTLSLVAVLLVVLPPAAGAQDKDKICRDVQNRPMTLHMRNPREQTEAWVRPELYFGMVKVVTKDGAVMALAAHGAGAKSSITETPREMPLPGH